MRGHNTFWVDSQVSFTFTLSAASAALEEQIVDAINLSDLYIFLKDRHFLLEPIDGAHGQGSSGTVVTERLAAQQQRGGASGRQPGVFVFSDQKGDGTLLVVTFFRFTPTTAASQGQQEPHDARDNSDDLGSQAVPRLVNLVNDNLVILQSGGLKLDDGEVLRPIPITAAAPHWLLGSSDHVTTGCPLLPPIPVPAEECCPQAAGLWPIALPHIPSELKRASGAGVTVLVLDTLPSWGDIRRASEAAGAHNLRLLDLACNASYVYPQLLAEVEFPNPLWPQTGKDIKGRPLRFYMPDHGLFVAGIVRDLAPHARVVCARVLNDLGAGATIDLIAQFQEIQRLINAKAADYCRDVVINLSLVIPSDEDLQGSLKHPEAIRQFLRAAMQSLAAQGVLFVAAAGNEGDSRQMPGRPRPDALYPAAFAYEGLLNLIPVGAANEHEGVAKYSCYPGTRGVTTYGGEIPEKRAIYQEHGMTRVQLDQLDALVGVYTQLQYPALSADDAEATYPAPNTHGWAYWIGTSFATPVVTAVVARTCELRRSHPEVLGTQALDAYVLKQAATEQITWDNLASASVPSSGGLIVARQCTCRERTPGQDTRAQNESMDGVAAHGHS
jgi:hypothetical protein